MAGKKRVLAIDDMGIQLAFYQSLLGGDYELRACKSAEKGLEILEGKKADIILLDLEMPGMSGIEFLQTLKLKPHLKEIPVIVISDQPRSPESLEYGADDFLEKPVNPGLLQEKIKNLLGPYSDTG
ncbi:MAG: response regulator [Spirochaetales bacterium]|nr:response regulator [Spirochaetales bacterium]